MSEKITGSVEKYYIMNPETEALIPNGRGLKNGMVVLIEDAEMRIDLSRANLNASDLFRAVQYNRWCEVSNITVEDHGPGKMSVVTFVGTYEDGTQHKRWAGLNKGWLAKKHTLTKSSANLKDWQVWGNTIEKAAEAKRVDLEIKKAAVLDKVAEVAEKTWAPKQVGSDEFVEYCGSVTQDIVQIFTGRKS